MKVKGKEEVVIQRIKGGIPLIQANNQFDQYFGLGYCHAVDRGMQLMMMKILGSGTASKHLEPSHEMFEIDTFFRRMNWGGNISEELAKLDQNENDLLEAYCEGINAGLEKSKPWELKHLLGFRDFHWSKEDTVLLSRMSGYLTLAQSQGEIERLFVQLVQKGVSKEMLHELFPGILGDYDESLFRQIQLNEKFVPEAVKWNVANAPLMASNNWVVGGSKSASGSPMLANDPHLEINRLPAVWYEVGMQVDQNSMHGATMPGLPAMIIGRNQHLSWGVTYAFMDATDSWIEKCKNGKYFKDGEWHDFTIRKEMIQRKKAEAKTIIFYENEHGILDGDPNVEGYYLSSKWSGDRSGAASIKAGFQLGRAKSVEEGMAFAGKIESAFSWVFADTNGNIGFQMSGLMPKRSEGVSGFAPLEGWSSTNDWQGYNEPEDLPRSMNPEEGFICTANNDLNHLGRVDPINMPMGDYRAKRIKQLIEAKDKHTETDFQEMQYDTCSLQAEQFMKIILPLLADSEKDKILREWDLCYDIKSKGAYLFEMVYRSLYNEVFGQALGKESFEFLQNETGLFIDFYQNFDAILLSDDSPWFHGKKREEIFQNAINTAFRLKLKEWGEENQIMMSHMILGGKLPAFLGFDRGPFPLPGGRASIHQGQTYQSAGRKTSFAPSFRLVTDMAEKVVYTNYAGGVSDRRFSKWYNNDFVLWTKGVFKKFEF